MIPFARSRPFRSAAPLSPLTPLPSPGTANPPWISGPPLDSQVQPYHSHYTRTQYIHSRFRSMSENNSVLLAPCPRRTITASSKLVDPQNMAKPIRSHKHAIEVKCAAELANKQLGGAMNGPPSSRPSRIRSSLSTPPSTVVSTPEPRSDANRSNCTTAEVDSSSEDSEDGSTERSK